MQNSKFLNILGALNQEEFSAFDKYLKRTLAKDSAALSLFRYIRQFYPNFKGEKKLELEYAYSKAIKSTTDNNTSRKTQLNVLSELNNILKEFLLFEQLKRSSFESDLLWNQTLNDHKLEDELQRNIARIQERTLNNPVPGTLDFLKAIYFNHENFYTYNKKKAVGDTFLQECLKNLDLLYVIFGMKVCCELINRKNMLSEKFDEKEIEAITRRAADKGLEEHPLFKLYNDVYFLLSDWQEQKFLALQANLVKNVNSIHLDDLYTVLSYLHNFTARQVRQGKEEYMLTLHQVNKFAVNHNFFLRNGILLFDQFLNIVSVAAFCKDFDWVEGFIQTHKKFLITNELAPAVQLSEAIVLFDRGNYDGALKKLSKQNFPEFEYEFRAKALTIRCYYELKDEDEALNRAGNFENYLKRGEKPRKEAINGVSNFLKIVKMLCRRKKSRLKIFEAINECQDLYFKSWLKEKTKLYLK